MSVGIVSAFSAMDFFYLVGLVEFPRGIHEGTKCYLSKFVVEAHSVEFLCSSLGDSLGLR